MIKKIKEMKIHESEYYHIPKLKGNPWFIPLTLLFGLLSYFNFKLILSLYKFLDLGYVFASNEELINYTPKLIDLIICFPLVFEYFFISLTIICLIGIFRRLNDYNEDGLIFGLVFGLIYGLVFGLVFGLIYGLVGLIVGLIVGLVFGLVFGLIREFE